MDSEETNIPAQLETQPVAEAKKPRVSRRTTIRKTSDDSMATPEAEGTRAEEKAPATKVRKTSARKPRASKASAAGEEPSAAASPAPAAEGEKPTAPTRVRRVSIKPREAAESETPASSPAPESPSSEAAAPAAAREVPAELAAPALPTAAPNRAEPSRPEEHPVHVREARDRSERRDREEGREPEIAPGFSAPETVGGNEGGGNGNRRKRRRRNRRGGEGSSQPQQGGHTRVDPEELVRRAWKIYLGEVTEEGLALMDDRTAAEAARRAFRVAELFLVEASRHRPSAEELMSDIAEEEALESPAEN